MWVILVVGLLCAVFCALFGFCVVGPKFLSDVVLIVLHRFPEDQRGLAKQFRQDRLLPAVGMSGGSVIYSGAIGMTYVGNLHWDSVVIAYMPSPVAGKQAVARIGAAERAFKQQLNSMENSNIGRDSEEKETLEGIIYPVYGQTPISYIVNDCLLRVLVNGCHKKQNEVWRAKHCKDEDENETAVGSHPIPQDTAPHLLPTSEQRQLFRQLYCNSEPISVISFIKVKEGETVNEFSWAFKAGVMCLGYVGGIVQYQSFFHIACTPWSYFNLIQFPNGGDSFVAMEDMRDYHDAFTYRIKSTESLVQFITTSDYTLINSSDFCV